MGIRFGSSSGRVGGREKEKRLVAILEMSMTITPGGSKDLDERDIDGG
jgi:hypothetical protein